ncbi:hypothetical protein [uncultured Dokdonia sp.]|uniref:energy transducer TonB n=1 Tax=uncultured Dokdonia sp. TaxID=575653 RepID=UPI0026279DF5|nr:hypothetical protein [uncultured Dokdonia sp.]
MNRHYILIFIFFVPLMVIGQIPDGYFLDADDSVEKGYKLKPFKQKKEGIYHYAILSELPFDNNCSDTLTKEEKIKCAEDTLNELIIDHWGEPGFFKSDSYVYITIDEKGVPTDINVKSRPHHDEIELMFLDAISRVQFKPAKYKGKVVKARLWAKFEMQ